MLKSALRQEPIRIFGTDYPTPDGTCIRDYVHVTDLAQAHLLALQSLMDGSGSCTYNLGNSIGYSVREVIDLAGKVTGCKISAVEQQRRAGDPATLVADSGKIKKALNWTPDYEDLESIITTAWKWIENRR